MCVFSRVQKRIPGLTHKGCVLQRILLLIFSLFSSSACTEMNPCSGLGRHATFANFFSAFLTLFRIATGDNWNGIMKVGLIVTDDHPTPSSGLENIQHFRHPM